MDIIKLLDGLASLAIIVASLVAIYGIGSWRREMKGRKEYELAEEVLALFYEVGDRIAAIRSPFGWAGEGQSQKADPDEKPEQKETLDRAYVVFERYQNHKDFFKRLHVLRYRFMSLFGQDKGKPFNDIDNVLNEILKASHMLGIIWQTLIDSGFSEKSYENHKEDIQKFQAIIWEGYMESDPITPRVKSIVSEIEDICKKIIGKEYRTAYKKYFEKMKLAFLK